MISEVGKLIIKTIEDTQTPITGMSMLAKLCRVVPDSDFRSEVVSLRESECLEWIIVKGYDFGYYRVRPNLSAAIDVKELGFGLIDSHGEYIINASKKGKLLVYDKRGKSLLATLWLDGSIEMFVNGRYYEFDFGMVKVLDKHLIGWLRIHREFNCNENGTDSEFQIEPHLDVDCYDINLDRMFGNDDIWNVTVSINHIKELSTLTNYLIRQYEEILKSKAD